MSGHIKTIAFEQIHSSLNNIFIISYPPGSCNYGGYLGSIPRFPMTKYRNRSTWLTSSPNISSCSSSTDIQPQLIRHKNMIN